MKLWYLTKPLLHPRNAFHPTCTGYLVWLKAGKSIWSWIAKPKYFSLQCTHELILNEIAYSYIIPQQYVKYPSENYLNLNCEYAWKPYQFS